MIDETLQNTDYIIFFCGIEKRVIRVLREMCFQILREIFVR